MSDSNPGNLAKIASAPDVVWSPLEPPIVHDLNYTLTFRTLDEQRALDALAAGDDDEAERLLIALLATGSQLGNDHRTWLEEREAWRAIRAKQYDDAARLLEPLAARGSAWAHHRLGRMYRSRKFKDYDLNKAVAHLEAALNAGDALSAYDLGVALKERGDLERARAVLLKSAEGGDEYAMTALGKMLAYGQGGAADVEAGHAWLTRAASTGSFYARRDLLRLELSTAPTLRARLRVYQKMFALLKEAFERAVKEQRPLT